MIANISTYLSFSNLYSIRKFGFYFLILPFKLFVLTLRNTILTFNQNAIILIRHFDGNTYQIEYYLFEPLMVSTNHEALIICADLAWLVKLLNLPLTSIESTKHWWYRNLRLIKLFLVEKYHIFNWLFHAEVILVASQFAWFKLKIAQNIEARKL